MKLYFNKTFGEYVCAGNGIAAMDIDKANAIKMALEMVDEDNTKKAVAEYSGAVDEFCDASRKRTEEYQKAINEFSAYDKHVETEKNKI